MQKLDTDSIVLSLLKTVKTKRLSQARLLVLEGHLSQQTIISDLSKIILCKNEPKPCNVCKSCQLIAINQHPDFFLLTPEKVNASIKVDQIRELPELVFTPPQLGSSRLVVIEPAEKMNEAAANALLKILEEPPNDVYFILVAQSLCTILPTILSRCQIWQSYDKQLANKDYLSLLTHYAPNSERGKIAANLDEILQDMVSLLELKTSSLTIAEKWSKMAFPELIKVLYLINASLVKHYFKTYQGEVPSQFHALVKAVNPLILYKQLDKLNQIMRYISQSISVNSLLTLEDFLLGYRENTIYYKLS